MCRVNEVGEPASAIASAIEEHPLAGVLTATVSIGLDGGNPWRADDVAPRVAVIAGNYALGRAQRAHLTLANAIVATDVVTARVAHTVAPSALVTVVGDDPHPFLRGANLAEAIDAWSEVGRHPDLAAALGAPAERDMPRRVADRAIELVIALEN